MNRYALLLFTALSVVAAAFGGESAEPAAGLRLALHKGWAMQSSCKLSAPDGVTISESGFATKSWIPAEVPTTVLAAQLAAGVFAKDFADPLVGKNFRKIPGTDYPIGSNFSNLPMSKDSPYACSWWYRTEFHVPAGDAGRQWALHFKGINYHANIWLNGKKVADAKDVAGAYRIYEFNVTAALRPGAMNVLAVETFAPIETDLGVNWVDWNPMPADKEMGLWGEVYLTSSGPVALRYPQAVTHLPDASLKYAEVTLNVETANQAAKPVEGKLSAWFDGVRVEQTVALAAGESRTITFAPEQFPALKLKNPTLWWPAEMGAPALQTLHAEFTVGGKRSDEASAHFGLREVTSEINDKGARLFRINGKPILIRGGGWSSDIFLRHNLQRLETDFAYVRDMHLNTIRLEGKLETDDFFDLADRHGILVMAGWCCCDHWEHWDKWQPGDLDIARESLRTQALRLRSHPSLLVWLNGSDGPPPANVESAYIAALKEAHWPNPSISSASGTPTTVTGNSGVKMTGPYDYVSPNYWLIDHDKFGGAFGFNTETSPGPAIPTAKCLKKMLDKTDAWPMDEVWDFHAGGEGFKNLGVFNGALRASYGNPANLDDYVNKSQLMTYDGERAMFEAYGRNKYAATGVIQWMLNNAWPSLIWHLYDYYQQPAGGYFGTKKACEPLHIQYSYDDHSVVLVNSTQSAVSGLVATAKVFDAALKPTFRQPKTVKAESDSSERVLLIPDEALSGDSIHYVQLELRTTAGKLVSANFYWIPAKHTEYDWAKTQYTHTPAFAYEDLKALQSLPKVALRATATSVATSGKDDESRVTVHNPSHSLALQVALELETESAKGTVPAPILWEDNYFALMPGESRTVTVTYPHEAKPASIHLGGFNVVEASIASGLEH